MSSSRAAHGSRRVQSWVYAVINPLLGALEAERQRLEKQDVSWRYDRERLAFIAHPRDYLVPNGQIIFDDFAAARPKDAEPIRNHAFLVDDLSKAASEAFWSLVRNRDFTKQAEMVRASWTQQQRQPLFSDRSEAAQSRNTMEFAERLVNNTQELPSTHPEAGFWSFAVNELNRFKSNNPNFDKLEHATSELKKDNTVLNKRLERLRAKLCSDYDIPAAPVAGVDL